MHTNTTPTRKDIPANLPARHDGDEEPFEFNSYDGPLDVPSYYGNDLEYFGYEIR